MTKSGLRKATLLLLLLTLAAACFILFNSSLNADESSKQSNSFAEIVKALLSMLGIEPSEEALSVSIRKAAHFAEYFLFGALAYSLIQTTRFKKYSLYTPFPAFLLALNDEFIVQSISDGRSPEWSDVLIDTCGALCAVLLLAPLFYIVRERRKRNEK